jgi:Ser/Thr protein kinase RdoA (MazF antagonist)
MPGYRDWLWERAAQWASRAAPLLTPDDKAVIRDHLAAIGQADIPSGGPCHLDFQPRNWLVSSPGDVSVIDFEHARIDLPARDLVRLRFRTWPGHPDLRDAFLDGYGRPLSPTEDRLTLISVLASGFWSQAGVLRASVAHVPGRGASAALSLHPAGVNRPASNHQDHRY